MKQGFIFDNQIQLLKKLHTTIHFEFPKSNLCVLVTVFSVLGGGKLRIPPACERPLLHRPEHQQGKLKGYASGDKYGYMYGLIKLI